MAVDSGDEVALSEERLDAAGASPPGEPWFVFGYTRYFQTALRGGGASMPRYAAYPARITTDIRLCSKEGQTRVGAAV